MSLDARQFLVQLQHEMAAGSLEIPGFPDACIRLMRELRDVLVTNSKLAKIIATDPGLSVRVIAMANSAAYQVANGVTTDVTGAISRIGLATLRTLVLAHAFATLRDQKVYQLVQGRMGDIWARCVATAVTARSIAGYLSVSGIDREAMALGGMLSGVGKIYLLAEMAHHEKVLEDFAAVEHLLETWHLKLTRQLLEQWEFPTSTIKAATTIELARSSTATDTVADILYVSGMFVDMRDSRDELANRLQVSAPAMRLGLSKVDPDEIFAAADREAASLQRALP